MPDLDDLVRQALEDCAKEFIRGVRSFNPLEPDVTIPDEIVDWLKRDENLNKTFRDLLRKDPDRWRVEGPVVCRSAFHAGSLAALHAYASGGNRFVGDSHVIAALEHVRGICDALTGVRWKWCRVLPDPMTTTQ